MTTLANLCKSCFTNNSSVHVSAVQHDDGIVVSTIHSKQEISNNSNNSSNLTKTPQTFETVKQKEYKNDSITSPSPANIYSSDTTAVMNNQVSNNEELAEEPAATLPFPKEGVSIVVMEEFIDVYCGGRENIEGLTTTQVCEQYLKPLTLSTQQSYCEMMADKPGVEVNITKIVDNMLSVVDTKNSEAWKPEDRDRIFDYVRTLPDGFNTVNGTVFALLRGWTLSTIETEIALINESDNLRKAEIHKILGDYFYKQGQNEEALSALETSVSLYTSLYTEKHQATLLAMNSLGIVYNSIGNYEKTLSIYMKTYDVQKLLMGAYHEHTLTALNNLAGLYVNMGRMEEALENHSNCLELRKQYLSADHSDILVSMNQLGPIDRAFQESSYVVGSAITIRIFQKSQLYYKMDETDKALEYLQLCYDKRKLLLGSDHPDTLSSMSTLSVVYSKLGRYEEAVVLQKQSLEIKKTKLGDDDPDTLISMSNLGQLYSEMGRLDDALEMQRVCLDIKSRKLGESHPSTMISACNYGTSLFSAGRIDPAIEVFEHLCKSALDTFGPDHARTVKYNKNLDFLLGEKSKQKIIETAKEPVESINDPILASPNSANNQ
eukprot:gene11814-15811_t